MRFASWLLPVALASLVLLLSVLGTFHDDRFYDYGYGRNGAYDRLDRELVSSVTENFQAYIDDDEELLLFDGQQEAHLEDVKGLYLVGVGVARVLVAVLAVLLLSLGFSSDRRSAFARPLRRAGIVLLSMTVLLGVLSLRWEWFFTRFHELLFTGNWRFPADTLMLTLWGGSFFPLAAGYVLLKNAFVAGFLIALARIIAPRSASRSA